MDWIIEPISGFSGLNPLLAEGSCRDGATLRSCSCTGGLLICDCSGGLKQTKIEAG